MARRRKPYVAPGPSADESALFRTTVADVVPLVETKQARRANLQPTPPPAIVHEAREDDFFIPFTWAEPHSTMLSSPAETGEAFSWLRPGLPRKLLADLKQARWQVEAALDLHGYDRDGARDQLIAFIARSIDRHLRCVRIVHGQGRGISSQESVLKSVVRRWLAHRPEVLAYCQTPARDGGAGAVWVLLRRN